MGLSENDDFTSYRDNHPLSIELVLQRVEEYQRNEVVDRRRKLWRK